MNDNLNNNGNSQVGGNDVAMNPVGMNDSSSVQDNRQIQPNNSTNATDTNGINNVTGTNNLQREPQNVPGTTPAGAYIPKSLQ